MKRRWIIKNLVIRDTDSVTERDNYIEVTRDGVLIAALRRELVTFVDC